MNITTLYMNAKAAIAANKTVKMDADKKAAGILVLLALAVVAVFPDVAMAAPWDGAAEKVLEILTGGLTRTIAIIAVIACGIAAIAGKLSWDWAIKIIIGIVLIFGAASIVDYLISAAS